MPNVRRENVAPGTLARHLDAFVAAAFFTLSGAEGQVGYLSFPPQNKKPTGQFPSGGGFKESR